MNQSEVKKAEGRLGILVVGLGAVSTTFITGVLMARKGLAKPIGSSTQYDVIRVGPCSTMATTQRIMCMAGGMVIRQRATAF